MIGCTKTAEKIILMRVLPKKIEGALETGIWTSQRGTGEAMGDTEVNGTFNATCA